MNSLMNGFSWLVRVWGLGWAMVSMIGIGLLLGLSIALALYRKRFELSSGLGKFVVRITRKLPALLADEIARKMAQSFYSALRNAYVTNEISDSTKFLDNFFEPLAKQQGIAGEVWLFQTDLAAFRSQRVFNLLYGKRVLQWPSVGKVRAIISPEIDGKLDHDRVNLQRLLREWRMISDNLNCIGAEKVVVKWLDTLPAPDKGFRRFISDENWILYVRFRDAHAYHKICIHRRFLPVDEEISVDGPVDERITITGSFPRMNDAIFPADDPVSRFVKRQYLARFEEIFTAPSGWRPLKEIASEQIHILKQRLSSEKGLPFLVQPDG